MALYANPTAAHRSSFERINVGREVEEHDKSVLSMETLSDDSSTERVNVFVVFVFILELLVLVFVAVLEFFLRFTEVFPVRHLNFSCLDQSITLTTTGGSFKEFAYDADIPFEIVGSLCLCIPPFIIIVGEIALWAFAEDEKRTVRVLCTQCKMPQIVRRIIRYIGSFLFGLFLTMVFTDVIKLMVGRLRPNFLEVCNPNYTECSNGGLYDENICREKDLEKIRDARLSFPSLHASMTSFASGYLAIYLHNSIRAHSVRVMRPFISLSFVILSVLCCCARYGLNYSHWSDVLAGFLLGMVLAIYIGVFVLNNFREYLSSQKLYLRLRNFLAEQRALELRDMYKEDRLERYSYFGIPAYNAAALDSHMYAGNMSIPRPQMRPGMTVQPNGHVIANETSTDPIILEHREAARLEARLDERAARELRAKQYRMQDTFQRDLQRTLDQYRRESGSSQGYPPYHLGGHM